MKHLRDMTLTFTVTWIFWLCQIRGRCLSQVVQPRVPPGQQVPCFYIFGDSLVDNGNNNGILTLARANYRPYGIDFPGGATGRFTNGRTYVDALGTLLYQLFIYDIFIACMLKLVINNMSTWPAFNYHVEYIALELLLIRIMLIFNLHNSVSSLDVTLTGTSLVVGTRF